MADINIIEKLQKLMITTPEEDKQYLNEIIDELQQSKKKPRGRPRKHNKENEDIIKENEDIIKEDIIRESKKGKTEIIYRRRKTNKEFSM